MSFVFPSWSTAFSPAFHEDAKAMLEGALNKGNKPPVIQGRIEVVELSMGKEPPTLTLLEIGDLSLDRFRGILRLGYSGDAWLEVRCRVQANPLSHNPNLNSSLTTLPLSTPLLASQPLLVPMTLRLSKLHLRAILILVVSQSKGITLVFKNDPLQNVDVSSTFDSVEVIRGYLQQEIEGQLREMFREDLPGIIHRLSQRWFHNTGTGGKVETPYKDLSYNGGGIGGINEVIQEDERENQQQDNEIDDFNPFAEQPIFPPHNITSSNNEKLLQTPRRQAVSRTVRNRRSSTSNSISESPTSYTIFPDIEDYDPTYGLRPEGVPTHSGYEAFGRLWEKSREGGNRGLGSLMSMPIQHQDDDYSNNQDGLSDEFDEDDEDEEEEVRSFDMVEMDDALRSIPTSSRKSRRQSLISAVGSRYDDNDADQVEWETFPAVGGGVITRPRVYHSQSLIRAPSEAGGGAMPSPAGTATGGSVTARASSVGGASSTIGSPRMRPFTPSTPGIGLRTPMLSQAGPSSLRRMVTSRSDVFLSSTAQGLHMIPRSESYAAIPGPVYNNSSKRQSMPVSRRQSNTGGTSSSNARTSGSSWDTNGGGRPNTSSTIPSSISKPLSISSSKPPQTQIQNQRGSRNSFSISGTSPSSFPPKNTGMNGGITLPNNSVSQLATLSHSAHTLSPYARGHEHIAVRSFPYLGRSSTNLPTSLSTNSLSGIGLSGNSGLITQRPGTGENVVKARRKRIHRLNTSTKKSDSHTDKMTNVRMIEEGRRHSSGSDPSSGIGSNEIDEIDNSINPQLQYQKSWRPNSSINQNNIGIGNTNHYYNHNNNEKKGLANIPPPLSNNQSGIGLGMGMGMGMGIGMGMGKRPNLQRSPASRTSYGFPES